MCGRFALINSNTETLKERFALKETPTNFSSRYNIAPTNQSPVIINTDSDRINLLQWGLIPYWAKDTAIGNKLINARAESIYEKHAFNNSFRTKRCLVIADSFYEWQRQNGKKRPYRISFKDNQLFAFAGIWDSWHKDTKQINTFTIITTTANAILSPIHTRMPVILERKNEKKWLSNLSTDEALYLLRPLSSDYFNIYEISTLINNPANDTVHVISRPDECMKTT